MARLLFFGRLSDAAGASARDAPLPDGVDRLSAVRAWLGEDAPALAAALAEPSVQVMVNQTLVRGDAAVADGDEIAFMSPMSGG